MALALRPQQHRTRERFRAAGHGAARRSGLADPGGSADHHDRGKGRRVSKDRNAADDLDRRVPQASEGARIDRQLSWSGQISPPEPSRDLELMERVYGRLRDR